MARLMLTDELWSKLKTIMLQHGIYDKPRLRIMVEGVLYRMRVGCPWRDLPPVFGCWNSIYKKFNRWSSKNKIYRIFKALVQEPDLEWEFIDGSIIKAHQHSAGAASKENQAIGKSKGGNTTKIHFLVPTLLRGNAYEKCEFTTLQIYESGALIRGAIKCTTVGKYAFPRRSVGTRANCGEWLLYFLMRQPCSLQ